MVSYIKDDLKYIFPIEPMYGGDDIVYLPNNKEDCYNAIEAIQSISWNRRLVYKDANYEMKAVSINASDVEAGSLESTQAGQEFLQLNMFNPTFDMEAEKVHELWCILEKRFAENTEGKVTIITKEVVEGSVFDKITIPALLNNKKAVLIFEEC